MNTLKLAVCLLMSFLLLLDIRCTKVVAGKHEQTLSEPTKKARKRVRPNQIADSQISVSASATDSELKKVSKNLLDTSAPELLEVILLNSDDDEQRRPKRSQPTRRRRKSSVKSRKNVADTKQEDTEESVEVPSVPQLTRDAVETVQVRDRFKGKQKKRNLPAKNEIVNSRTQKDLASDLIHIQKKDVEGKRRHKSKARKSTKSFPPVNRVNPREPKIVKIYDDERDEFFLTPALPKKFAKKEVKMEESTSGLDVPLALDRFKSSPASPGSFFDSNFLDSLAEPSKKEKNPKQHFSSQKKITFAISSDENDPSAYDGDGSESYEADFFSAVVVTYEKLMQCLEHPDRPKMTEENKKKRVEDLMKGRRLRRPSDHTLDKVTKHMSASASFDSSKENKLSIRESLRKRKAVRHSRDKKIRRSFAKSVNRYERYSADRDAANGAMLVYWWFYHGCDTIRWLAD